MIMSRRILISCLLAGLCAPAALSATGEGRIVVLLSSSDAPFTQAAAGFSETVARPGAGAAVETVEAGGDADRANAAVRKAEAEGAKLIFAVGTAATKAAIKAVPGLPVVSCLVLHAALFQSAGNATGVELEYPPEAQIDLVRRTLPRARTFGIMYNPAENQPLVDAAAAAAKRAGLRIEAAAVRTAQDVPAALNMFSRRVDALWVVPDRVVLSPPIAKNILLFSFRNSIPVIGPSSAWVKAGAYVGLDWDYAELGNQCGEMAKKVLAGTRPADLAAETPRVVHYAINLSTARLMKIPVSADVVRDARQVF
jgi:putative ABC transport system substrate-binding protein